MPDQLDVQIAFAINKIRRDANDARHRLGLPLYEYPTETADTVQQERQDNEQR